MSRRGAHGADYARRDGGLMTKTADRARLVREDCAADAAAVDRTPFTPEGVGPLFGNIYAMIGALAQCIEELSTKVAKPNE
jgi:hypothetical protein